MTGEQADYTLIFDGGSLGNPGPGYGSYVLIRHRDGRQRIRRLNFKEEMTSNEAEYRALIAGLEDLLETIRSAGRRPSDFSLEVRGDSRLILNQVAGTWKTRQPHLMPLCDRARELLNRFGAFTLTWQGRERSEEALGH
ncbi:MAG TPA: ribonuclease HI family protein [Anaerolineae bacterium]|nr:ribonuclease HI family protein [Anaerolineae bacterium]